MLTRAAEEVTNGKTDVKVEIRTGDEIEILSVAFNDMVADTRRALREIRRQTNEAEHAAQEARDERQRAMMYQHHLSSSIKTLLEAMERFSNGDLTVQMPENDDEILNRLFTGFNGVVQNIHRLTTHVVQAVEAVTEATAIISASTQEISASMNEQKSQASEIAAAIAQMNTTIAESTHQASVAADESANASTAAQEGGTVMHSTLSNVETIATVVVASSEKITALGDSSRQISEIVRVIDEIADQTNLLALNAAIEAARAGEQGRGFAVVADEVRKLDERTQQATKEISTTIRAIQHSTSDAVLSMQHGKSLVQQSEQSASQASTALETIIHKTRAVANIIAHLASISQEQSAASTEITRNVDRISSVTEQTAAGTVEIARISEQLHHTTERLQTMVSQFYLGAQPSAGQDSAPHGANASATNALGNTNAVRGRLR